MEIITRSIKWKCLVVFKLTILVFIVSTSQASSLGARTVRTKQGLVKGVLVVPPNKDLQPVEAFLGIPYASPPVGALRFMPPVSPLPWNGIRLMDKYGPACPQTLPDVGNEREALRFVTKGRLQYLRRLLPYLRNQSEDCLYLNIYAPVIVGSRDSHIKFPVLVFIHGESFEWNSGNPYDGSILASYGDVVVVTLNFRLSLPGFLRPGLRENTASNFGLLDQVAALQWVKENVVEFGGDPEAVTLVGHGTGAACVNLLLVSPVAQASSNLFHRAILMSGSALADWAVTKHPLRYTLQAAQQLDCPLAERSDELATCLRYKRITELMSVRLQAPLYASPLAPVVDGIAVPNEPRQLMETYQEVFGRYDLMYGVTQSESFHLLNANTVQFGLTEAERNRIVRTYVRNNFEHNIDLIVAAILNEYTNWRTPGRDTQDYRDSILDILSDARVVAPVVQTGDLHSAIRAKSYFYVFGHQTTNGDYPDTWGSLHGEELPYVFGMPLVGGTNHFSMNYTRAEMLLSEMVMTYWTNFARTGDPNYPPKRTFLSLTARDRFEPSYVQWPPYDRQGQKYLSIELRPKVKDHYRADKMALWSKLVPDLLRTPGGDRTLVEEDELTGFTEGNAGFRPIMPVPRPFPPSITNPAETGSIPGQPGQNWPHEPHNPTMGTSLDSDSKLNNSTGSGGSGFHEGSVALSIVIVIGICFLVLNLCACAGVFYQRDRVRLKERLLVKQYTLRPAERDKPLKTAHSTSNSQQGASGAGSIAAPVRNLPHQVSTSTMDPHTKVREWINHEISPSQYTPNRFRTTPNTGQTAKTTRLGTQDVQLSDRETLEPLLAGHCSPDQPKRDIPIGTPQSVKMTTFAEAHKLHPQESKLPLEIQSTTPAPSTTTVTGGGSSTVKRRAHHPNKARQQSLHRSRSVTKRDVAVGDSDDPLLSLPAVATEQNVPTASVSTSPSSPKDATPHDAMTTIKRLNLPKVLPDLPLEQQFDPLYAVPVKKALRGNVPNESPKDEDPYGFTRPKPAPPPRNPSTTTQAVLENPPRALVSQKPSHDNLVSIPEPELVVRPGKRHKVLPTEPIPKSVTVDTPLRNHGSSGARTPESQPAVVTRPRSQHTKSWYAQYSQAFISQSIDQPDITDAVLTNASPDSNGNAH